MGAERDPVDVPGVDRAAGQGERAGGGVAVDGDGDGDEVTGHGVADTGLRDGETSMKMKDCGFIDG